MTVVTDDCITRLRLEGTKCGSWFTHGCSVPVPVFRAFGTFKLQGVGEAMSPVRLI